MKIQTRPSVRHSNQCKYKQEDLSNNIQICADSNQKTFETNVFKKKTFHAKKDPKGGDLKDNKGEKKDSRGRIAEPAHAKDPVSIGPAQFRVQRSPFFQNIN